MFATNRMVFNVVVNTRNESKESNRLRPALASPCRVVGEGEWRHYRKMLVRYILSHSFFAAVREKFILCWRYATRHVRRESEPKTSIHHREWLNFSTHLNNLSQFIRCHLSPPLRKGKLSLAPEENMFVCCFEITAERCRGYPNIIFYDIHKLSVNYEYLLFHF